MATENTANTANTANTENAGNRGNAAGAGHTSLVALFITEGRVVTVDPSDGSVTELTGNAGDAPDGVAVVGDTVYWTTMGAPDGPAEGGEPSFTSRNGGVHAIGLDGTGQRDVVPSGGLTTGKQLASDGSRLYWGDREGFRVSTCALDGSDLRDLVVNEDLGDWTTQCVGVAVDPGAGVLYWTQKGPSKGGRGRILRAPLTLREGESAGSRSDVEVLWDGLPEPIDLHVNGGNLYWTDRGAEPDGNTLNRAPLPAAGEKGAEPEILARGFHEAIGLAVDVDPATGEGTVYASDLSGEIRVVPVGPEGARDGGRTLTVGAPTTGLALLKR